MEKVTINYTQNHAGGMGVIRYVIPKCSLESVLAGLCENPRS